MRFPRANLLAFFLSVGFCLGLSLGCKEDKPDYSKQVVIEVFAQQMSAAEYAEQLALQLHQLDALNAKSPIEIKRAEQNIKRSFISRAIVQDWAQKNSVVVSDDELQQELNKVRSQFPSDEAFRKSLAEENISFANWSHDLRHTLLEKKVIASLTKTTKPITNEERRSFYQQNKTLFSGHKDRAHLRQIVLAHQLDAEKVLELLKKRNNFAELAREYSIAPEGKRGGDLGWIEKGTLDVFDRAMRQPVHARSSVVTSPYGYHIIEVLEKRGPSGSGLEQNSKKISKILAEKHAQETYTLWFEEQLKHTKVLVNQELIDALRVHTN